MITSKTNESALGNADGPDPVPWPGKNFEVVSDVPEFIHPERASRLLTLAGDGKSAWEIDNPDRASVENIYSLKKAGFPLEVRARIAGMGDHGDMDYIQYVINFKFLLGTQERGFYHEEEVDRGTLTEMIALVSRMEPLIAKTFHEYCKDKKDHVIISDMSKLLDLIMKSKSDEVANIDSIETK